MQKKKKFKLRAFVSLYMTIAFIIMIVSGIILYISPPGRIAHWSYWSLLGLTKAEWQATHIIFTFIFVIAGVLHIIYNWKPLVAYFANKISGTSSIRKELTLSIIFSVFLFVGTYYSIPPFVSVIDFGEEMTDSWSDEQNEPPASHAERYTISELAFNLNLSTNQLVQKLNNNGYEVKDTLQTLELLAKEYDVYPNEIYNKLINSNNINISNTKYSSGNGYGRKLLSKVFEDNNISWENGIEKLKKNNIIVTEDGKLKDIATMNQKLPIDIFNALK